MADNDTGGSRGGVGFLGLLTPLFVALKLMGYISWSWWWVLSPLLISIGLAVLIVACVAIVAVRQILRK